MFNFFILDGDNNVIKCSDSIEWNRWCFGPGNEERRRIDYTTLADVVISTVFLGVSSGSSLFETMVFPQASNAAIESARYMTYDEAKEGHDIFVRKYREQFMLLLGTPQLKN